MFLLEGEMMVMNATGVNRRVEVEFPSGQKVAAELKSSAMERLRVAKTGEGAIEVVIDGVRRERAGYVTSMNGILVLVDGEEQVVLGGARL